MAIYTKLDLTKYGNIGEDVELSEKDYNHLKKVFFNSYTTIKVKYKASDNIAENTFTYNSIKFEDFFPDSAEDHYIYSYIYYDGSNLDGVNFISIRHENGKYLIRNIEN